MTTRTLFIGGVGRSGTTLLERVVARLPGVVALGEVMHMWERSVRRNERCGCGQPFHDCPFWRDVGDLAFRGWRFVDVDRIAQLKQRLDRARYVPRLLRGQLRAGLQDDVAEYVDYFHRVYAAAATVSGATLVVDSSKQVSLAFLLSHDPGLDLRVVHCVRDARGVAYSWTKDVRRPEILSEAAFMPKYQPSSMSVTWNLHNAEFMLLPIRRVPVMRAQYEAFLDDPVSTLRRIAVFANIDIGVADVQCVAGDHVDLGVDHTAAGNPMRFTTGRVDLQRDDAWRNKLPVPQQRLVTAMTLPLLLRYGYSPRVRRSA